MIGQRLFGNSYKLHLVTLPFLFFAGTVQADALNLSLRCNGSGTVSATETTFKNSRNKSDHSKEIGTEQSMVKHPFSGTMLIEITPTMGQVKLPIGMLPPLQKDEAADWFPINDFKVTDTEVSGKVRINILNKPNLTIDRTTGTIVVANGLNEFSGDCAKIDANAKPVF